MDPSAPHPASGRAVAFLLAGLAVLGLVGLAVLGAGMSGSSWLEVALLLAPVLGLGLVLLWSGWSELHWGDDGRAPR